MERSTNPLPSEQHRTVARQKKSDIHTDASAAKVITSITRVGTSYTTRKHRSRFALIDILAVRTVVLSLKHRSSKFIIGFASFMAASILVGVLIVCLTAPNNAAPTCHLLLRTINAKPFSTDSHPRHIVTHDFNNDHKLDIAVAYFGSSAIGIFLAAGNGTFARQTTYATGNGSTPASIAVGDFNDDRQMDIVVANFGSHAIGILLGNSDGTFIRQTTVSVGSSRPLGVAVGDFNSDAQLDIVVVNHGTNIVGILFGHGDGTFAAQVELSAAYDSSPQSVVVSDFNNDNKSDLAVANYGIDNIVVLLGDNNGTFPTRTTVSTGIGSHPHAVTAADVNNDTRMDLVVANSGADTICILLGNGDGTFIMQGTYSTGIRSQPISVAIGDFNHDRRLDIVVSNNNSNTVGVFLGFNNGLFTNQTTFATGVDSMPYSVAGGDFDNDDRLDIAVATYTTNAIIILIARPNAVFSAQTVYSPEPEFEPTSIAIGNFNGDDALDAAVVNRNSSSIRFFLGDTNGYFSDQKAFSSDYFNFTDPLAIGDFNNDTFDDIAVGYWKTAGTGIAILLGDSRDAFSRFTTVHYEYTCESPVISVHDVNNDRRLDIVFICRDMDQIRAVLGYGNGSFTDAHFSYTAATPSKFAVADFDRDGHVDIAVTYNVLTDSLYGAVAILFGNGTGLFWREVSYSTGYYPLTDAVAVNDFNSDGNLDIVVANSWANNVGLFLGYGNGTFAEQRTHATGLQSHMSFVVAADFNNDSLVDIVFDHELKSSIAVMLGYGNGTFANQVIYPTSLVSRPGAIAFGDLNKDTLLDIVVVNTLDHNIGVLLGFANASFRYIDSLSTGSSTSAHSVALGDFNEDSQLDLVVANYITDNIDVFIQDVSGEFPLQATYSTGPISSPTFVVVDDFNNDTHLDAAVCNWDVDSVCIFLGYGNGSFGGRKTYYLEGGADPFTIASGDFNGDHRPDLIVANHAQGSVDVLLQYDSPHFAAQVLYATGDGSVPHHFAVGDFNNDRLLDIVVANNGKSNIGILFGIGNGTFSSQKTFSLGGDFLPVVVAVADFNNDSCQDIAVLDNANHRLSIVKGNGNGSFSAVTNYDTGNDSWPGAMTVGHLDNDSRLDVVVCNFATDQLKIFFGDDNGDFTRTTLYSFGYPAGPDAVAIDDFNNDKTPDVTTGNYKANSISILLGHVNGTFSTEIILSTGDGSTPGAIAVADFDQDGCRDIVVVNSGSDSIVIFSGYCNGTFSSPTTLSTGAGSQPTSLSIGDVNNDGLADILVTNTLHNSVSVFLGYIQGIFFRPMTYATVYNAFPTVAIFVDLNSDSLMDIVVCNRNNGSVGVFFGDASGSEFLRLPPYSTGLSSHPRHVVAGHFNNDRHLDVAIANDGTNNVMILCGSGYGTFTSEAIYSNGPDSRPHSIAVGDINEDGRVDLVVANSGSGTADVFLGNADGTFSHQRTYSTGVKSEPSSIAIGDFNNDTLADLAVANYGSNDVGVLFGYGNGSFANQRVVSMGYGSRPVALASGDMNSDNVSDIIITNNGYGTTAIILKLC